jgi:hypothetical protein
MPNGPLTKNSSATRRRGRKRWLDNADPRYLSQPDGDGHTGFGEAGYWIANNKLPSGSASNSEATSRASTRSALFHLFQSSIQSVFHLMLFEMEASRACPPDNSGQRFDNDCRRPTLGSGPIKWIPSRGVS